MAAYLDVAGFKSHSVMPDPFVDDLEARYPGWLANQLSIASTWIDARLAKRYAVPFAAPYPLAVRMWLAQLVTPRAYHKRGIDALDQQIVDIKDDEKTAKDEIAEAANSETGLFDLPLRDDTSESGIVRGGPFGYSEQSPYVWMDEQERVGRGEDSRGSGTDG